MAPRSKVNQQNPRKTPLLDMAFISANYEIDGLHNQGTIGWKRKQGICTDGQTWLQGQRLINGHTAERHIYLIWHWSLQNIKLIGYIAKELQARKDSLKEYVNEGHGTKIKV